MTAQSLVSTLNSVVINPLLLLLFTIGFLIFLWGLVEFLWNLQNGSHDADKGKWHMLYGVIGMFIMTSAYAILKVLGSIVGQQIP